MTQTAPKSIDAESYKAAMRLFGGAVTVLSTMANSGPTGLTATAVCSLSAEPPRLLACVNRDRFTYRAIAAARSFCVNLLHEGQAETARRFAGMTGNGEVDRFAGMAWRPGHTGAPVLDDALASFDCRVHAILDSGSHGIIIGDVVAIRRIENAAPTPLFYADGQFTTIIAAGAEPRHLRA